MTDELDDIDEAEPDFSRIQNKTSERLREIEDSLE